MRGGIKRWVGLIDSYIAIYQSAVMVNLGWLCRVNPHFTRRLASYIYTYI